MAERNNSMNIQCPACAESILKEATKCKHCGEVVNRSVGLSLGLGILFIPGVFSWFTLRKGYSFKSKLIAFTWLFCVFFSILRGGSNSNSSSETQVPVENIKDASTSTFKEDIWRIENYVDEFGAPIKNRYLVNKEKILGHFSNSATTNSKLLVDIIIDRTNHISLQLFEYAGKNPMKAYGATKYYVSVKDKNEKKYTLTATNYSDRLLFDQQHAKKLHNILKSGGRVLFALNEAENSITTYNFIIENADGYTEKFNELKIRK